MTSALVLITRGTKALFTITSLFAVNNHNSHLSERHVIIANLINSSHDFRHKEMAEAE
jgi:hypothetical protein